MNPALIITVVLGIKSPVVAQNQGLQVQREARKGRNEIHPGSHSRFHISHPCSFIHSRIKLSQKEEKTKLAVTPHCLEDSLVPSPSLGCRMLGYQVPFHAQHWSPTCSWPRSPVVPSRVGPTVSLLSDKNSMTVAQSGKSRNSAGIKQGWSCSSGQRLWVQLWS